MTEDRLEEMFRLQCEFMELLRADDKLPEWPVDLTSKPGQRLIREIIHNLNDELAEASMELRNKLHRRTDVRLLDREHYVEELGDAFAYFMEACIFSGVTPQELFEEYRKKNLQVKERFARGY